MKQLFESAWVIARRDFIATVMSRSFILFLLAPLMGMAFAVLIGEVTRQTDQAAAQPRIAIVSDGATADAVREARDRLAGAMGAFALPDFRTVEPEKDVKAQITRLLASDGENVTAVLTGTLAKPVLTGPQATLDQLGGEVGLVVNDARRAVALADANVPVATEPVATDASGPAAGNLNRARYTLARFVQTLILILSLILVGMMVSSLVEEKSNKVIEVLSASVPLDAVFLGKLIGMLGVSLVGVAIWGSIAGVGLFLIRDAIGGAVSPAVGWPAFGLLILVYFAFNYMLLGAAFLAIGGQASSVREVQTLTMPITFTQLALFALAGAALGGSGTIYWIATIFPLSSPIAMIAVAAQTKSLWPHLLAMLWQLLWVAIIIRISARMFRRTVLKSGKSGEPLFRLFPRKG